MVYENDINKMLSQWQSGLVNQSADYKVAVMDCIYDLRCLMDKQFAEEALARECFEEQLADNYLSSIEAHDSLYCD